MDVDSAGATQHRPADAPHAAPVDTTPTKCITETRLVHCSAFFPLLFGG